jgi:hypothetical protein
MARRIAALLLWAYFGWFLTATIASLASLPVAVGPIGGLVMAAFALVDWRAGGVRRPRSSQRLTVSE